MSALLLVSALSHGNTERFMPTSNKLLAMCPSVCRSAPPRCSCYFTSSKNIRSLNLSWSERNGNTERFMPTGQWAIGNVSITFLKTPIYFPLFSSLHRHNPQHGMSFTLLKTVRHSQDKVPVLGHLLKKNLHIILRNLKEEWRRKLMSWTTGMITEKCFLALQLWQGTFYAFPRHLDQPKNSSTLLETSLIPFELSLILLKQKK